jgi:hypothetical protein
MDLQHTISILHNIHIILIDYPRIITQLSSTPAQLTTMVNELTLAVQNLTSLKESKNLQEPLFCSKVARQLISTAASFMDDVSQPPPPHFTLAMKLIRIFFFCFSVGTIEYPDRNLPCGNLQQSGYIGTSFSGHVK